MTASHLGKGNTKMRHFIKSRVFPRRFGHRNGDGSGSRAKEPTANPQTSLQPSEHSGADAGGEVTESSTSNPHESHTHDHGKSSQSLSGMQETVPNPASHQHGLQLTFEGLPPEIRLRIFEFGLGIEDLRAAVRASPSLHRQYLDADRRRMLQTALDTSLGPAFIAMWAVHATSNSNVDLLRPSIEIESERIVKFMTKFLDLQRSWAQGALLSEHFRESDLVEMSRYYLSTVKPVVAYFSDLFLGNLCQQLDQGPESILSSSSAFDSSSDNTDGDSTNSWQTPYKYGEHVDGCAPQDEATLDAGREVYLQRPPSSSEAVRIVRALYHVQMWCNIFGYGADPDKEPASVPPEEVPCMFHETFEPWEVEEMLCIFQHMKSVINDLFHEMRDDLLRYDEQHRGEIPFFTSHCMDIRDYDVHIQCFIQSTVSRGLPYFLKFLAIPEGDRDARLRPVVDNVGRWLLKEMLVSSTSFNFERRDLHPSPNDVREKEQVPLLFLGDSFDTKLGPPFGWCLMWRGTYSNRYGDDIPDKLRHWGYVFWDRERVIGSTARRLLLHTWRDQHWEDPRNFPF
ncbi:hypothetical protein KVR01_004215 [Diaporthe batatas]|uniref:uncharacterized protein n=1 Tax=Diaporthe batatas TaxID=748121 RepID=UPI001D048EA5|nr:uncharacterized protein KVR01_004215 [Diaporthe batatas]KAG8165663.1 hypothetical protein KVR01_004215 [Diaporthe batatas]